MNIFDFIADSLAHHGAIAKYHSNNNHPTVEFTTAVPPSGNTASDCVTYLVSRRADGRFDAVIFFNRKSFEEAWAAMMTNRDVQSSPCSQLEEFCHCSIHNRSESELCSVIEDIHRRLYVKYPDLKERNSFDVNSFAAEAEKLVASMTNSGAKFYKELNTNRVSMTFSRKTTSGKVKVCVVTQKPTGKFVGVILDSRAHAMLRVQAVNNPSYPLAVLAYKQGAVLISDRRVVEGIKFDDADAGIVQAMFDTACNR